MQKNKKSLRYAAGACFGICSLIEIIWIVLNILDGVYEYYGFSPWHLIWPIGYALIAVSMFASIDILTSVGGGILTVVAVRLLIDDFGYYTHTISMIEDLLWLIVCILLVVIGLNRKNVKMICIVAGALLAVRFFLIFFGHKIAYGYFGLDFSGFLQYIILIVGTILIGLALNIDSPQESNNKTVSSCSIKSTAQVESKINQLVKLKDFLDNGYISQEEFDAKKKQILGQ